MFPFPLEIVALVLATFLFGGISKGLIGLGLPVVVLALLAAPLGVPTALALMVVPAVLTNIWQALDGGALFALLRRLWSFFLAAICGVTLGGFVLAGASEALLLALLGGVLTVYAGFGLLSPPLPEPGRHEVWMAPSAALAGGVMFGMVGNFIVPGVLYLQAIRLGRDGLVQALGMTFIVISSTLGVSLTSHSVLTPDIALVGALCVPSTLLGMVIGRRIRRHVSEETFRRLFLVGLLLTGIYNLVRAAQMGG
ncbi:MAG: sulfite exporter TauE/SafE family protein [Pseudomonadota bacterium]